MVGFSAFRVRFLVDQNDRGFVGMPELAAAGLWFEGLSSILRVGCLRRDGATSSCGQVLRSASVPG